MKLSMIFFLITFSMSALAEYKKLTYSEVMLKKDSLNEYGLVLTAYLSKKAWCLKRGTAIQFGSFESTKSLEDLENGFYDCKGQFAIMPFGPVNIFKVEKCTEIDLEEMNKECENLKK